MYSTGNDSIPFGIAVGDFNNDKQPDIVITDIGTHSIGVFLGYYNESFATMKVYSTGKNSTPIAVAVGDFNNDTQMDIVVANKDTNNVGILLGFSNGRFSTIKLYPTGVGSSPRAVTVGDFNNDGRLDIVVANQDTYSIGILTGNGDGTFQDQVIFSVGFFSQPWWLATGDFNGDNQLDIVTANWNANNVGILLGYGNGSFAYVKTYSTGYGSLPKYVSVGDFNNDNILDIAVVSSGTRSIMIFFGFGDGSFLSGRTYSTGSKSSPYASAIGDFNKDNQLDIAIIDFESGNIIVFFGYEREPFGSFIAYYTGDGSKPHSVAIDDLNNDSRLDIVVANYGADNIAVFLGLGNRLFVRMMTYSTGIGSAPYSIAINHFNKDKYLDIVVINSKTNNIAILPGFGNGSFGMGMTYSTGDRSRPYAIAIGDFNNDRRLDIVVANSGTSKILILYGNGDGTFRNITSYALGYGYHPYSIALIDLNKR